MHAQTHTCTIARVQIKEAKSADCVCPICFDFEHRIEKFNVAMANLREKTKCKCCHEDPAAKFVQAFKSPHKFREAATCRKVEHPGLELPHNPDYTPKFRPVACVCDRKTVPHKGVAPCLDCGIDLLIPVDCPCLNEESLATSTTWLKRQPTSYRQKKSNSWTVRMTLREYEGSVGELLDEIKSTYKYYLYHSWYCTLTLTHAQNSRTHRRMRACTHKRTCKQSPIHPRKADIVVQMAIQTGHRDFQW